MNSASNRLSLATWVAGLTIVVLGLWAVFAGSTPANGQTIPQQAVFLYGAPPVQALVGAEYYFAPQVVGPPTSEYFFMITNQPAWADFNPNSGLLRGTPTTDDLGTTAAIVISVTDGEHDASLPPFSLTVVADDAAIDDAPVFQYPQAPPAVNVGELYYWDPGVYDPENEDLVFSAQNLPAWLTIDPVTGIISGVPGADDVGAVVGIVIIATEVDGVTASQTGATFDALAQSTAQTLNLQVNNPNLPYSPSSLSFCAPQGAAFPAQTILIPKTTLAEDDEIYGSTTYDFSATVNNDYSANNSSIKVTPLGTGLTSGMNAKKVSFKLRGATHTVPVTIIVGTDCTAGAVQPAPTPAPGNPAPPPPAGALQLSRAQLEFAGVVGQPIATQSLTVNSTGAALNWSATSDHSWLKVSANSGVTPQTITISIDAAALSAGEQHAKISFRDPHNAGVDLAVVLRLTAPPAVGAPPSGDVQVTALEVTQGIQNLLNQMDLIAKRLTFVRAHVKSTTGAEIANVSAKLIVRRDSTVLGTLAPINEGKTISVKSSPDRKALDDSFLFELDPSWTNGTLTFEFASDSRAIGCADINNTPNDCQATVSFQAIPAMPIQFYKGAGAKGEATDEMVERARKLLLDFMPIGQMIEPQPPIVYHASTSHRTYLSEIDAKRGSARVQYYGIVPGAGGGIANCPGFSSAHDNYSTGLQYVGVHEFEHNSGLPHFDTNDGGCSINYADLPQYVREGRISEATDGPTAYYGIRRYKEDDKDFRQFGGPLVPGTVRIDIYTPSSSDALFRGYQGLPKFISAYAYKLMLDQIKTKYQPQFTAADLLGATVPVTGTLISGQLTGTTSGSIDAISQLTLPDAVSQPPLGDYQVRLEGANGAVVATLPAVLQPYEESVYRQADAAEPTIFTALIGQPLDASVKRIVLRYQGTTLASVDAPASAPQISELQVVQGDTGLAMNATVASGQSFTYRLEVSRDAGATWVQVAAGGPLPAGPLATVVDPTLVPGSLSQQWRLVVSDGFYTTAATTVTELEITNKAPVAYIVTELTQNNAVGDQTIYLEGYALDLEDGRLGDDQLNWYSDRDGYLGSGSVLVIAADRLSEGRHLFSLEAIDSEGQSSIFSRTTETVRQAAARQAFAPLATTDLEHSNVAPLEIFRNAPYQPPALTIADLWIGVAQGAQATSPLALTSSGAGSAITWEVASATLPSWMSISQASGQTPAAPMITVNAGALAVGDYTGSLTFTATYAGHTTSVFVPYTVVVGEATGSSSSLIYLPVVQK